ncbi:MAG: NAD(P)/FAD-dependent oxidoreductase [Leptolyngbya sp. UWPOB_LEPTO1]|uniref:NAD(P)/FAD-dependent oxidoreductase n=1 Tax=Leptolyngbya sp. UWPOB_LEPTO1 TaxID=2815653 RepID=UPI001ACB3348|nr:NAD(P)/FAD-dependent oxidoreductase [Leptolyngbya sp. UWPOB_LEPTO1]MBN8564634.1 NAD(P)/FAD-dependent oxidoreductase [Leptolyngbya sp. UWPOB_LEPTO1]
MKVVVIGGGAAGFFGAICAAQAGAEVTLLEAGQNCLSKVLISGGGRCNVTHSCFEPALLVQHYPRGGKALRGAFSQFQPKHTIAWFTDRNVKLKTETDGRIFPITDDARTIADCLLNQAADLGVKIYTQSPVKAVAKVEDQFLITLRSEQVLTADRVLIATGSNPNGYQFARSLGHSMIDPVPSLFTFNIRDDRLTDLAGVSVDPVRLRLQVGEAKFEQAGALLITHWGVSGPAVLKLSAWAARELHDARYQARFSINWLPKQNPDQLRQELTAVRNQIPQKTIAANCPVMLPRRLWERLTEAVGIQKERRWAELSNKTLNQLIQELMQGSYQISGKGVFKEEFVTCGGVNLKEIDFKTMESRCCSGLYFAGEVLDIDGVTGGFNFQSAWTTGWIAGNAIAKVSASVHRPQ